MCVIQYAYQCHFFTVGIVIIYILIYLDMVDMVSLILQLVGGGQEAMSDCMLMQSLLVFFIHIGRQVLFGCIVYPMRNIIGHQVFYFFS